MAKNIKIGGPNSHAPVSKDAKKRGAAVLKPLKGSALHGSHSQKDIKQARKIGADTASQNW
jgi:hypothetical protein